MLCNHLRAAFLAAALGGALCGCGGSCKVGLGSGRTVSATSDTHVAATGGPETSTVKLGDSTIVVEPKRVLIDGHEVAHMPANVRSVKIERKNSRLTVVADKTLIIDSVVR